MTTTKTKCIAIIVPLESTCCRVVGVVICVGACLKVVYVFNILHDFVGTHRGTHCPWPRASIPQRKSLFAFTKVLALCVGGRELPTATGSVLEMLFKRSYRGINLGLDGRRPHPFSTPSLRSQPMSTKKPWEARADIVSLITGGLKRSLAWARAEQHFFRVRVLYSDSLVLEKHLTGAGYFGGAGSPAASDSASSASSSSSSSSSSDSEGERDDLLGDGEADDATDTLPIRDPYADDEVELAVGKALSDAILVASTSSEVATAETADPDSESDEESVARRTAARFPLGPRLCAQRLRAAMSSQSRFNVVATLRRASCESKRSQQVIFVDEESHFLLRWRRWMDGGLVECRGTPFCVGPRLKVVANAAVLFHASQLLSLKAPAQSAQAHDTFASELDGKETSAVLNCLVEHFGHLIWNLPRSSVPYTSPFEAWRLFQLVCLRRLGFGTPGLRLGCDAAAFEI